MLSKADVHLFTYICPKVLYSTLGDKVVNNRNRYITFLLRHPYIRNSISECIKGTLSNNKRVDEIALMLDDASWE